eukprot:COSAG03_NODE_5732_length_1186_cov_1.082797_2_plen_75_part_00
MRLIEWTSYRRVSVRKVPTPDLQVRISDCAKSNLHTNLKRGPAPGAASQALQQHEPAEPVALLYLLAHLFAART